jgi:AraC family transcriptional regulator, regulatory protein of adaptative response / methylated-DNA-[protein]-cysteine methyltransferase
MQVGLFDNTENKKKSKFFGIQIIPMKMDEVAELNYSFMASQYGEIMVASSKGRIHWASFIDNWKDGLIQLSENFPEIKIVETDRPIHDEFLFYLENKPSKKKLKLYPVATDFQEKVWNELMKIPSGQTTNYSQIARSLNLPVGASRTVGTAIGKNPIALLIPCHRVIQSNGKLAGYRWGLDRKKRILLEEMNI